MPVATLDLSSYESILYKDLLETAKDWHAQVKMTDGEIDSLADLLGRIAPNPQDYDKATPEEKEQKFSVQPAANKAELLARFQILSLYSPVLKEVYEKHKDDQVDEEETPAGQFLNRILLLEAKAVKGVVSSELVDEAHELYELCERSLSSKESLKQPLLRSIRAYQSVWLINVVLGLRYKNDREKRKSSMFRKPQKLTVSDYLLVGEKGLWGLVTHLNIEGVRIEDFGLFQYPALEARLKSDVIDQIFSALLADGENPKAYPDAFDGIEKRYHGFAEHILKRLTTSR